MSTAQHPDLPARFLEPEGWRWHNFERNGRRMRFGSVSPKDSIPDAVIVCVQGVREFSEKYFETARWALDNNMAFWVFDWVGQGLSARYLKNPQKRHGEDFSAYVADLHYFILEYIKHSSVHPDRGRIPMALLAHSMGANIGLRFLHSYPEMFECAALSAPMIGIHAFRKIPQRAALAAAEICKTALGGAYIPGGGDWTDALPPDSHALSGDIERRTIHNAWMRSNPALRCGDVTFGWLYHAQKSCIAVQNPAFLQSVKTPMLVGIPSHEFLVDNDLARRSLALVYNARVLDLDGAHHEVLMERDEHRNAYLGGFYDLIKERIINRPETLKPF